MTQSNPSAGNPTPAENIARVLGWLRADAAETRLEAFTWLARLPYSSPELLRTLEQMALTDPDERVRQSALAALDAPAARAVYRSTKLPWELRVELLQQIDRWLMEGRLERTQAEVLRKRYAFDTRPAALSESAQQILPQQVAGWLQQGLIRAEQAAQIAPQYVTHLASKSEAEARPAAPAPQGQAPAAVSADAAVADAAAAPVPAETPAAAEAAPAPSTRQTALQVIFSETSIRIALFLGGFLIVSAALILAAILEVARLPILLGLTAVAGVSAAGLKRRLPLPAFVLFIIFVCLLPIDARIWADLQGMQTPGVYAYWALVWVGIAAVLAGGSVLFRSRLFSLAALLGLETAALMLTLSRPDVPFEVFALLSVLACLLGLLGAAALRDWQDWLFARPLFWLAQGLLTLTLGALLVVSPAAWFESGNPDWLLMSAAWLGGALFYLASDLWFQPFFAFPFLAAGALLLVPVTFFVTLKLEDYEYVAALAAAGLLYTGLGNFLQLRSRASAFAPVKDTEPPADRLPRYGLPLLIVAVVLLLWATFAGLDNDPLVGFIVLVLMTGIYSLLHAQKNRLGLWLVSLLSGLFAYFVFYELPQLSKTPALSQIPAFYPGYRALLAGLVLTLPDLLRGPDRAAGKAWTLPARWLGVAVLAVDVMVTSPMLTQTNSWDWNHFALILAACGLLCLGYGLRFRWPWLGYGFAAFTALTTMCLLLQAERPDWMLTLAGLALLFSLAGWAVLRVAKKLGLATFMPESETAAKAAPSALADAAPGKAGESQDASALENAKASQHAKASQDVAASAEAEVTAPGAGESAVAQATEGAEATVVAQATVDPKVPAPVATTAAPARPGLAWRWSGVLRFSALAITTLLLLRLPFELVGGGIMRVETAIPFVLSVGPALALLLGAGLWLVELLFTGIGWFEFGLDALLIAGVLRLVHARTWSTPMLGLDLLLAGLIVLGFDLFFTTLRQDGETRWLPWTKTAARADSTPLGWTPFDPSLRWVFRLIAAGLLFANTLYLIADTALEPGFVAGLFLVQTLVLLLAAWLYEAPQVAYLPAASLPLALFYGLRYFHQPQWLTPLVGLGILYYAAAFLLRAQERPGGRVEVLRTSGLGLGMLAALAGVAFSTSQGGLFASLPVAAAATLYAVEAFRRRNVWLGFPANGLYLLAYYVILYQLKVDQPQYYSVGVAVLGMLMHFLLLRTGNSLAAFITGMVSQCALLGTTYIQMYSTNQLSYFVMLFFQGLIVLAYGIVIRSRSLVLTPLVFIVLGVITVVLSVLSGVPTAIIIGCTGVLLLVGGILAVVMRERLIAASDRLGERLGGWRA